MHSPLTIAFEVHRPWPELETWGTRGRRWCLIRRRPAPDSPVDAEQIATGRPAFPWYAPRGWEWLPVVAGRRLRFPALVTVWHREPGGADSGEVCRHYVRRQRPDGTWHTTILHGWRWHVHHWKIQVHPLQELRRWLLTRCAWCNGPHRKGSPVNVGHGWGSHRGRWWQGESGLYHRDCSGAKLAHDECVCESPVLPNVWEPCLRCGKHRSPGRTEEQMAHVRRLAATPEGQRPEIRRYGATADGAR